MKYKSKLRKDDRKQKFQQRRKESHEGHVLTVQVMSTNYTNKNIKVHTF